MHIFDVVLEVRKKTNQINCMVVFTLSVDILIHNYTILSMLKKLHEALAIRKSLRAAKEALLPKVWMRSDSQMFIKAINWSKIYSMELFGVLMDAEFLSSSFDFILFSFVPRAQNSTADSLAKSTLGHGSFSSLLCWTYFY